MRNWAWANSGWREFIAADSRKKILQRRDLLLDPDRTHECGGHGQSERTISPGHPDSSTVIHTLSDDSTIRKLNTHDDHKFESDMQGNCVRDHAFDGNVHSLRDKNNVPILSFAMETEHKEQPCTQCHGDGSMWNEGQWRGDDDNGYQEDGEWVNCDRCGATGNDPEGKSDGILRISRVLRKENDPPKAHELTKLIGGLKDHYSPTHPHLKVESGPSRSWDDIDHAIGKAANAESTLPQGDVYVSIPEHRLMKDDEGNVSADHLAGGTEVSWSKEDPGVSPGNYVMKTPFTPRRFKHETGLMDHLVRGTNMKEQPDVWVSRDASFPPNAHSMVHTPERPTKIWVTTDPKARSNPEHYRPEGMNTKMVTGNALLKEPGHIVQRSEGNGAMSVDHQDLWEVNFKDQDEARQFTQVNQYGHDTLHVPKHHVEQCPTCHGEGNLEEPDELRPGRMARCEDCRGNGKIEKPNILPWDRLKLVRPADESKVNAAPMPTFHPNDDGSIRAEVKEPEFLHIKSDIFSTEKKHPWQALHDLEHTGLSQEHWSGHNLQSYEGWTGVKPNLDEWRGSDSAVITIPNDPKYVEPIPAEENSGPHGKFERSYRLKEGVTIPRSQYTLEHKQEGPLAPEHAYLHIQHQQRDNEDVFTDKGINVKPLTESNAGYRDTPNQYKITTTPNTDLPEHWNKHHPFSPQEADIFKLDLSKMPKWSVGNARANHQYAEASSANVSRVTPSLQQKDAEWEPCDHCRANGYVGGQPCTTCGGSGKQLRGVNPHLIPWDAVVGLHSKAEVQPAEEFKKRFALMRSKGWGDIRSRKVKV